MFPERSAIGSETSAGSSGRSAASSGPCRPGSGPSPALRRLPLHATEDPLASRSVPLREAEGPLRARRVPSSLWTLLLPPVERSGPPAEDIELEQEQSAPSIPLTGQKEISSALDRKYIASNSPSMSTYVSDPGLPGRGSLTTESRNPPERGWCPRQGHHPPAWGVSERNRNRAWRHDILRTCQLHRQYSARDKPVPSSGVEC